MSEDYKKYLGAVVKGESGNEYIIKEYISQGGNGFVFKCSSKNEEVYILKLLYVTNEVKISNFKKEICLQKSINSKYVVKCLDSGERIFAKQKNLVLFIL